MMPSPELRARMAPLLRFIGGAVFLASLYGLYRAVEALEPGQRLATLPPSGIALLILSGLAYAALLMMLAIGWNAMAGAGQPFDKAAAIAAYGQSVLAKYLPGSVFQYASRQVLGMAMGFAQKAMGRASLVEIALHVVIAAMVAALLLMLSGLWPLICLLVLIAGLLALLVLKRRSGPGFAAALGCQTLFFAGFAILAAGLGALLTGSATNAVLMAGLFLAAWLAGFLVPFAPGGLGVREAALVAAGAGLVDPALLLSFAALTRLMTLGGDLVFGLACHGLRRNRQASLAQ